jgi:ubiquinone/menaquinone biosynthesis C-methylase UbiE
MTRDANNSTEVMNGAYPWEQVGEAFGRKAWLYDSFGREHPNLARMRAKVRAHVEALLSPGASLLEINAGTGADAAYFAQRGYSVHATDLSAGMVAQIRQKISSRALGGRMSAQQVSFTELGDLQGMRFDGVLSNLGGVNCAPDLEAIAHSLPGLLKPGSTVTWVVMPPVCLWELAQALRGNLRLALRRLKRGAVQANVEGIAIPTYYYAPRRVRAAFGPNFQVLRLEGLSVFTPPADHKEFPTRYPRLYRLLVGLDDLLADRFPFYSWGDFYILSLRYAPKAGEECF